MKAIRRFWVASRHRLPQDRRAVRPRAGHALRHECLDSRRLQGSARRSPHAARAPAPLARRDLRREARCPPFTSMPSRASCLASGRRATSSARTSSISATPSSIKSCCASTPATFIPPRVIADKLSAVLLYLDRDPAARQPRRALGQRPRGDAHRRRAGYCRGNRPRRVSRPRAHRPRFLRRQHQSRRRLGDRHAGDAQGIAPCPAWSR